MRQHLLHDPDHQPAPVEEAGWLRLSAALTREIGRLADRDDLIVQVAPGAGRGAPGCFVPAATIELDGNLLPKTIDPARARPRRPSDREHYPACGACCATRPATPATPAGGPPGMLPPQWCRRPRCWRSAAPRPGSLAAAPGTAAGCAPQPPN